MNAARHHTGRISEITEGGRYGGRNDHVHVRIVHGIKRRDKSAKKGEVTMIGHDRPESSIAVGKRYAKGLSVGQKVHVSMHSADDCDGSCGYKHDDAAADDAKSPATSKRVGQKQSPAAAKRAKGGRGNRSAQSGGDITKALQGKYT